MSPPNVPLPEPSGIDWEQFRRDGHRVIDYIADYHIALGKRDAALPVTTDVKPGFLSENSELAKELAGAPEGQPRKSIDELLATVDKHVMPGMVHWQHPNFFGYFPAVLDPNALLSSLLADSFNQPGFSWAASPAATELEFIVTDWLVDVLQLPAKFKWGSNIGCSVLQPSATEAVLVAMIAARSRCVRNNAGKKGFAVDKLVCYYSDQSHFCIEKAARVLGVQHRQIACVFSDTLQNFPLAVADLECAIEADLRDGLVPFFANANYGTTSTCAVDPIQDVAAVAKRNGMWMHVDGAYAGATAICPEMRGALGDLEELDSIGINGSKWMSMTLNTSFLFLGDRKSVVESLNSTGPYLRASGAAVDFKDYQLGLARPFRGLKLLGVIQMNGADPIRRTIRRHVMLASYFDGLVSGDSRFEIVTKTAFGLVVFRLVGVPSEATQALGDAVNASRAAHIVSTIIPGKGTALRVAFSHHATEYEDADRLFAAIVGCLPAAH
jgi:glutamate/tyrosine decarboxylase-like PLP-dependent enzyme